MNRVLIERVADALLYEGYILYPYRPTSVKNRKRFTFGGVYPRAWSEACRGTDPALQQTQTLVRGSERTTLEVRVRFLHLVERQSGEPGASASWQEAVPRDVTAPAVELGALLAGPRTIAFRFEEETSEAEGVRRHAEAVAGTLELAAERLGPELFRVTARVRNTTPFTPTADREDAVRRSLASTHTILSLREGESGAELVSLLEPPDELRAFADGCENVGTWPVLVGEPGSRDAVLSSPIIVYDYPELAPESPGDLYDATEIDEILTLRVLTLTEDEKRSMRAVDARARALLERTEGLTGEDLMKLHGALRDPAPARAPRGLRRGARVRLRPKGQADIFDIALAGKTATIQSVERDYEGKVHVAVTIDDDPGQDLGAERQVGHRFFFHVDEVEPLDDAGGEAAA